MTVVPQVHLCQSERMETGSLREQAVGRGAATAGSFRGRDFQESQQERGLTGWKGSPLWPTELPPLKAPSVHLPRYRLPLLTPVLRLLACVSNAVTFYEMSFEVMTLFPDCMCSSQLPPNTPPFVVTFCGVLGLLPITSWHQRSPNHGKKEPAAWAASFHRTRGGWRGRSWPAGAVTILSVDLTATVLGGNRATVQRPPSRRPVACWEPAGTWTWDSWLLF